NGLSGKSSTRQFLILCLDFLRVGVCFLCRSFLFSNLFFWRFFLLRLCFFFCSLIVLCRSWLFFFCRLVNFLSSSYFLLFTFCFCRRFFFLCWFCFFYFVRHT